MNLVSCDSSSYEFVEASKVCPRGLQALKELKGVEIVMLGAQTNKAAAERRFVAMKIGNEHLEQFLNYKPGLPSVMETSEVLSRFTKPDSEARALMTSA